MTLIDLSLDCAKRVEHMLSIQPLRYYINKLLTDCNINLDSKTAIPTSSTIPLWEPKNVKFDLPSIRVNFIFFPAISIVLVIEVNEH